MKRKHHSPEEIIHKLCQAGARLRQLERTCEGAIPPERPRNACAKLDAFAIVRYSDNGARDFLLGVPSQLSPQRAGLRLAETVFFRLVAAYAT